MKVQQMRQWPQPKKRSFRQITISLSPKYTRTAKPSLLQRLNFLSRKSKPSFLKEKPAETYSLSYIGDTDKSGKLTISTKRSQIPFLTKSQVQRNSRSVRASPTFELDGEEHRVYKVFKPKPLTPAAMRLYEFSDYRHRATANRSFRSAQRLKSFEG